MERADDQQVARRDAEQRHRVGRRDGVRDDGFEIEAGQAGQEAAAGRHRIVGEHDGEGARHRARVARGSCRVAHLRQSALSGGGRRSRSAVPRTPPARHDARARPRRSGARLRAGGARLQPIGFGLGVASVGRIGKFVADPRIGADGVGGLARLVVGAPSCISTPSTGISRSVRCASDVSVAMAGSRRPASTWIVAMPELGHPAVEAVGVERARSPASCFSASAMRPLSPSRLAAWSRASSPALVDG